MGQLMPYTVLAKEYKQQISEEHTSNFITVTFGRFLRG